MKAVIALHTFAKLISRMDYMRNVIETSSSETRKTLRNKGCLLNGTAATKLISFALRRIEAQ